MIYSLQLARFFLSGEMCPILCESHRLDTQNQTIVTFLSDLIIASAQHSVLALRVWGCHDFFCSIACYLLSHEACRKPVADF